MVNETLVEDAQMAGLSGLDAALAEIKDRTKRIQELEAINAELLSGLKFYINPQSWSVDGTFLRAGPNNPRLPDCGDTARAAINKARGTAR